MFRDAVVVADDGAGAEIAAGAIVCNYDGVAKHRTDIGKGAFIGSNAALVSPVTIGDGAYVATGSVVTHDVPADALAIARSRQVVKENRAGPLRALKAAGDRKSTRLNSSHQSTSRMPSSA